MQKVISTMLFYYSGCGNSKYIAQCIAEALNEKLIFIPEAQRNGAFEYTLAENEMVAGSDTFLEEVDQMTDKDGEVHITCSDNNEAGIFMAKLLMKNHNQFGATYILTGPMAEKHDAVGYELWICNVTHDVLGEHPRSIYIHDIK